MKYDPNLSYEAPIVTPLRDYYRVGGKWYDSFFDSAVTLNISIKLDERYTGRELKIVTDCTLEAECLQIRPKIDKDGRLWI